MSNLFPPKPNAIATLFTTKKGSLTSSLTQIQTLVFSIHKSLQASQKVKFRKENPSYYPPEILILIAVADEHEEDIIKFVHKSLSVFAVRIIKVDPIYKVTTTTLPSDNEITGEDDFYHDFSELHLFNQQCYNSIFYIEQDCLITQDISHIFHMAEHDSKGIIAASSHEQPDRFGSAFMLLRPLYSLFSDMISSLQQTYQHDTYSLAKGTSSTNYNHVCAQFLNFFYSSSKSHSNAMIFPNNKLVMQSEILFKERNATNEINVFHFSFSPKPWQENIHEETGDHSNACALWNAQYKDGQSYIVRRRQRQKDKLLKKKEHKQTHARTVPPKNHNSANAAATKHKSITTRYKMLRKQGLSSKAAMMQSRTETGDIGKKVDPGASVAAMFGLS